jgi:Protein of unknown function (DUF2867)
MDTVPYGWNGTMRVPNTAHHTQPWRIHELTRDFRLEDVWQLPGTGDADDFPHLVQQIATHIGRVSEDGSYSAQMAVLVKPNGLLGTAYMTAIRPFRHLIVYPAILRELPAA